MQFSSTVSRRPSRRGANVIAVLWVVVLGLVLAACAGTQQAATPSEPGVEVTTPTAPRPLATAATTGTTVQQPPERLPAPGATAVAPSPAAVSTPVAAAVSAPEPPATGQPDRLVIPKINLDVPVVDVGWTIVERPDRRYTEWETADNAAGRHINSARPGEQGNVVLSGHHNTKGEVFRAISDLQLAAGDPVYLYDQAGQRFTYVVDEVTDPPLVEVGATDAQRLSNARYIQPTEDARVTLVTCWPYWSNTHRVVVVAKLVE
jgi:sortase A